MSILKNILGNSPSKEDVQKKAMEGIIHYKGGDYKSAVKSFEQYFELKRSGKFSDLDQDDAIMLFNLGNAKLYSLDFQGAISVYDGISKRITNWGAPYLMNSICQYKLGNISKSRIQWELARKYGNDIAQNSFDTEIIKF